MDGSDASVSVSDSVEIEHPPRAEDAEDEKRASPASSTRAKPLETESAAVRAYRESRAAADASVERLAAARATLATAANPPAKASPPPAPATPAASSPPAHAPAKPTSGSPALAEALASLRDASGPGDAAEVPGARARALASIRRVLRGGAAVTAEEARAVVAAATRALARAPPASRGASSFSPRAEPEPSAETKTHALFTLRDLARCSPEAFAPHANAALPVILDALEDPEGTERDPEIALGAGDALDGVVDAIAPEAALRALAPRLALTTLRDGGPRGHSLGGTLSAAPVRCVGGVAARMSADALRGVAPEILPGLVEAFNSTSADVRKAVVDALVGMHDALGDWLLPRLSGLTAAQQKLLTIYINRAAERRGKGGSDRGELGAGKNGAAGGRVPLAPRPAQ